MNKRIMGGFPIELNAHLKCINSILIDLKTRHLILEEDEVIFSEMLNDSFIVAENMRNCLKEVSSTFEGIFDESDICKVDNIENLVLVKVKKQLHDKVINAIRYLIRFQTKWSLSYNAWLSSFKSHRENKSFINSGNDSVHLQWQCMFPSITLMQQDIDELKTFLKQFIKDLEQIEDIIKREIVYSKDEAYCNSPTPTFISDQLNTIYYIHYSIWSKIFG